MRKITVIEATVIRTGTSSTGKPWTLYEIAAVNEDGAPIEEKLKSFDKLEGTVNVDVERQEDPKYGVSYMLKLPAGTPGANPPPAGARLGPKVDEIRDRLDAAEERIKWLETAVAQLRDIAGFKDAPPTPSPTVGAQF